MELGNLNGDEFLTVNESIDTGSTYTTVPASVLDRLGMAVEMQRFFRLVEKRVVGYETGYARIRYGADESVVRVVFGPEEIGACIVATTLENLVLAVDLIGQPLVPVESLMRLGSQV